MTAETLFADRYRLERRLGVGGMATVQLALDTRLERHVAVKLLAEHLAEDSSFVSRFRREALAAARLVHPNIVQVFDFGQEESSGRQFIVMEFVDGLSCAEILRELGRLEPDAGGRDPHPGVPRARLRAPQRRRAPRRQARQPDARPRRRSWSSWPTSASPRRPSSRTSRRSAPCWAPPPTSSPEQARGEPAGPASDLYALGVVSYQLLGGRLPYDSASLTDLARQQSAGEPLPLHELDPEIPRALSAVVARALARDPADRFADAAAMEHALRDGVRGVAPEPPTAATRVVGTRPGRDAQARAHGRDDAARADAGDAPAAAAGADRRAAAAARAAPQPRPAAAPRRARARPAARPRRARRRSCARCGCCCWSSCSSPSRAAPTCSLTDTSRARRRAQARGPGRRPADRRRRSSS